VADADGTTTPLARRSFGGIRPNPFQTLQRFLSWMRFSVVVRKSVKALLAVKAGRLSVWSGRTGQPKMVSRFVGSR